MTTPPVSVTKPNIDIIEHIQVQEDVLLDRADEPERDGAHDDQRLHVGVQRHRQQREDHQQPEHDEGRSSELKKTTNKLRAIDLARQGNYECAVWTGWPAEYAEYRRNIDTKTMNKFQNIPKSRLAAGGKVSREQMRDAIAEMRTKIIPALQHREL